MLHVTNGDCAVEVLRKAGMQGDILPWRDVLHEGPVDTSLPLEALSKVRARFIAEMGWASRGEAEKGFIERDERLRRAPGDDEVVLWFEHDLYDQLQLVQVLAWFAEHPHPRLTMVCETEYLGEMKPERAAELFNKRNVVTKAQLDAGMRAWRALPDVGAATFPELRFLDAALRRFAAERPAQGLSRTEELALQALADGPLAFEDLFRRTQEKDEPRFLGDTVFLKRLERLERLGRVRRKAGMWRAL